MKMVCLMDGNLYGLNLTLNDADADYDIDGLTNLQEYENGTLPYNQDTDGDGLKDGKEIEFGTDPTNPDTDGDVIPDGWEIDNMMNPNDPNDSKVDFDGDGLTNLQKYYENTDPSNNDTDGDSLFDKYEVSDDDGDGLSNGWEIDNMMNPNDPNDSKEDFDGDGLTNLQELENGTNLLESDTDKDGTNDAFEVYYEDHDGNGIANGWEYEYDFDPFDSADTIIDTDGDGLTTLQEYQYGTDPTTPDTDGDGISDGVEINTQLSNKITGTVTYYNLNLDPLDASDKGGDINGDGIVENNYIYLYGTDPMNPDTDGDGLKDGDEFKNYTNPLMNDTDGDGLTDGMEILYSTNPNDTDTDGDGWNDSIELNFKSNPLNINESPFLEYQTFNIGIGFNYSTIINNMLESEVGLLFTYYIGLQNNSDVESENYYRITAPLSIKLKINEKNRLLLGVNLVSKSDQYYSREQNDSRIKIDNYIAIEPNIGLLYDKVEVMLTYRTGEKTGEISLDYSF